MKKFVLLLSIIAFVFTSCEGPTGPQGEPGKDLEFYREYFEVKSGDWISDGSDDHVSFYKYLFTDVDVSDYTYDKGVVFVFLYRVDNKGNETQTLVPFSYEDEIDGVKWKEKYDYDFDGGSIGFYAECPRGQRPPTCEFRVVMAP